MGFGFCTVSRAWESDTRWSNGSGSLVRVGRGGHGSWARRWLKLLVGSLQYLRSSAVLDLVAELDPDSRGCAGRWSRRWV